MAFVGCYWAIYCFSVSVVELGLLALGRGVVAGAGVWLGVGLRVRSW